MNHDIPLYICSPFVILLLLIAILPLTAPRFWDKNRNKAVISFLISVPVLIFFINNNPHELLENMKDYASFIILLASLFIISGGILLTGDLRATPAANTAFLAIGGIIANFIGTTGASMLLIRPILRTNSERKFTHHIPVFFIFIVSNIGGCLTPLGDPPLFMGYLKGVPFSWTFRLAPEWLATMGIVLAIFYIWDFRAYRKEAPKDIIRDLTEITPLGIEGKINLLFILGVILAVFFRAPAPYRELVIIVMTLLSLFFTKEGLRKRHKFTYYPIMEVAILFAGIFVTMVPILMLLHMKGSQLGITKPWEFFWWTGILSSFLDNTPTYLTFFSLAQSVTQNIVGVGTQVVSGVQVDLLRAISCGAIFMGANTYIGNGPNFMVKSIAEEQGVKVPHFFGYMAYSGLILIPVFLVVTLVFFP